MVAPPHFFGPRQRFPCRLVDFTFQVALSCHRILLVVRWGLVLLVLRVLFTAVVWSSDPSGSKCSCRTELRFCSPLN